MKVGQIVFISELNYKKRNPVTLIKSKIKKIGSKWFTTENNWIGRFSKETLLNDGKGYSSRYKIYLNEDDYHKERKISELSINIRAFFNNHYGNINLPLDKLILINDIVTQKDNKQ